MIARGEGIRVMGRGESAEARRNRFDAPALAAIRYADPAAWVSAAAVAEAMGPVRDAIAAAGDRVGVIAASAEGPLEAIAAITAATRDGFSSPIRYPASNPGSLAGLTCIALGFRGPSIMLTMPPARGAPVGLLLAEAWLGRGVVSFVALTACAHRGGKPAARCLLLAASGGAPIDREADLGWIAGTP